MRELRISNDTIDLFFFFPRTIEKSWLCESSRGISIRRGKSRISRSGGESNSLMASKGCANAVWHSSAWRCLAREKHPSSLDSTLSRYIRGNACMMCIYIYVSREIPRVVRDCNWSSWCLLDLGKSVSRNGRRDAVWSISLESKLTRRQFVYSSGIILYQRWFLIKLSMKLKLES